MSGLSQTLGLVAALIVGAVQAPQDSKQAKILRLIEITGAVNVERTRELFELGMTRSGSSFSQAGKEKVWQEFVSSFPRDEAIARTAALYDETFSEGEIEALLAFYDTPVGRKVLQSQTEFARSSILTMQDLSARTVQQITTKLFYYLQGDAFQSQGQLEPAIESFRKAVTLYPDDADFREALGRALATVGRVDESRVELEELARLRPDRVIHADALSFAGLWQFEDRAVWIEIFEDGRVFQCRIAPNDDVFQSEGTLRTGQIVWRERWGTETVTRTESGITVGENDFIPSRSKMGEACRPPEAAESPSGRGEDRPSVSGVPKPMFLEPSSKRTFGPQRATPQETQFYLKVLAKVGNEAIRIHRCGVPCDTATTVKVWTGNTYSQGDLLRWSASQEGKYYFWVQHGTTGSPIAGSFEQVLEDRTRVVLESGTILEVWYVAPD